MTTVVAVSNNPTSPVYNSNAPNLTGQVGSLLSVLDAVLVNGFTGFTAAGWSKPYSNSGNLGCYKNGTGGTGFCLAVNDNAPGAGGAKEARVCGFQSMTSVSAGSGQFPLSSQSSIGAGQLVVRKSATADSTVRYWTIVADPTCFYMFCETGDQAVPIMVYAWMFGDFFTYCSSDTSNCMIIARTAENTTAQSTSTPTPSSNGQLIDPFTTFPIANGLLYGTLAGHYAAANYTNVGGSIQVGKHTDQATLGVPGYGSGGNAADAYIQQMGVLGTYGTNSDTHITFFNFPNGPDNGLYTAPMWIHTSGYKRGYLKGLWCPLQHLPLDHNDTYSGTGNLSGKSLLSQMVLGNAIGSGGGTNGQCQVHVETSSTWS